METIVQKFGGTSVGSVERIQHVANLIIEEYADSYSKNQNIKNCSLHYNKWDILMISTQSKKHQRNSNGYVLFIPKNSIYIKQPLN